MFEFFQSILSAIDSVVTFFANVTYLVIDFFENALDGVGFLVLCIGYLPPFLIPIVTCLLGLAVVKFILSMGAR